MRSGDSQEAVLRQASFDKLRMNGLVSFDKLRTNGLLKLGAYPVLDTGMGVKSQMQGRSFSIPTPLSP